MSDSYISRESFEARNQLDDERFARDKERIGKLESTVQALADASLRLVETQKRDHEDIQEHAKRLSELEHRPGQWMDKIVSAALSSGVAAIVSFIVASLAA